MTPLDVRTAVRIALLVGLLGQGVAATPSVAATEPHHDVGTVAEAVADPAADAAEFTDLPRRLVQLSEDVSRVATEAASGHGGPPVVFVTAAYSRSVTREPLAHERRRELFELIHTRPGISRTTLAEASEVAPSTVRYHVDILKTAGMVRTLRVFGQVRLAEASVPREHVELRAALADAGTAPVLAAVARQDGPSVSDVATELGKAPSTISYHVDRLEAEGLLDRERSGRRVEMHLTRRIRSVPIGIALESYDLEYEASTER